MSSLPSLYGFVTQRGSRSGNFEPMRNENMFALGTFDMANRASGGRLKITTAPGFLILSRELYLLLTSVRTSI